MICVSRKEKKVKNYELNTTYCVSQIDLGHLTYVPIKRVLLSSLHGAYLIIGLYNIARVLCHKNIQKLKKSIRLSLNNITRYHNH